MDCLKRPAGIGSGFWWSAVTMTTVDYGDKAPITFGGRVVAFIWMLIAIIIVSVFTATITSTLTVAHLDVPVKGPQDLDRVRVGAIANTTGETYLQGHRIAYTSYMSALEGLHAIKEGEIEALVYDAPILRYLIHNEFQGALMSKKLILTILAAAVFGLFFIQSNLLALDEASSLECDGGTVSQDDSEDSVRDKCGEPQKVTREDADSPIIWFYNFGPSEFVSYVSFTNGIVERIQTGGYGD